MVSKRAAGLRNALLAKSDQVVTTITEKLLTYALGRGLESSDVETVDRIVARLDRDGGRFSALLMGVIESAPFQKRRNVSVATAESTVSSAQSTRTQAQP